VSRLSDDDPTKVIYLRIKSFIPSNRDIEIQIEEFDKGDVIFLRGKFIACAGWYSVCTVVYFIYFLSYLNFQKN